MSADNNNTRQTKLTFRPLNGIRKSTHRTNATVISTRLKAVPDPDNEDPFGDKHPGGGRFPTTSRVADRVLTRQQDFKRPVRTPVLHRDLNSSIIQRPKTLTTTTTTTTVIPDTSIGTAPVSNSRYSDFTTARNAVTVTATAAPTRNSYLGSRNAPIEIDRPPPASFRPASRPAPAPLPAPLPAPSRPSPAYASTPAYTTHVPVPPVPPRSKGYYGADSFYTSMTSSAPKKMPVRKIPEPYGGGGGGSGGKQSFSQRFGSAGGAYNGGNSGSGYRPPKKPVKRRKGQAIKLSGEQNAVLDMVVNGVKNVFFTGSAGTGKSVLLRELIRALEEKYTGPDEVAVTASTGIAACNIGGSTLHSFAGCGLGLGSITSVVDKVTKNHRAKLRWSNTKVLIVDVSMVEADFFNKLEACARSTRKNEAPFGGIQLVLTGDFFQLPPVNKGGCKYAFEASTWNQCIHHSVQLSHVFRQQDSEFVEMLNEVRFGTLSPKTTEAFRRLSREPQYPNDNIQPTHLYPTRNESEGANKTRLANLPGDTILFTAQDYYKDDQWKVKLDSNCLAPRVLELRLNAQVMLLKNLDQELVNGSRGVVVAIEVPTESVTVKFTNGRTVSLTKDMGEWELDQPGQGMAASRKQIPLMLAWSMTMHKAQGQTIERLKVDLGKTFECGQIYVALSRATSMSSLQVLNFDPSRVRTDPRVVEFMKNLKCVTPSARFERPI